MRREVVGFVARALGLEKGGSVLGPHFPRVGSRSVQERAAGTVDRPHHLPVEGDQVVLHGLRIIRVRLEQTAPSAADPDDLMPGIDRTVHDGLNARIESGDVAAPCQNAEFHLALPGSSRAGISPRKDLLKPATETFFHLTPWP